MLFSVFAFELRYALRQPAFWIISAGYFLFAFLYISSSVAGSALATTAVNVNSPWAITRMVIQLSYIGLLGSAAFVGSSIIRDFSAGISSILFTTQLVKPAYVFGRFFGGVTAALLAFSFVFLGLALGGFAPWADARVLGPFPGAALATAFFVFAVPNVIIGSAALFAVALLTKDTVKTYVAAVAILIAFFISRAFAGAFYATEDAALIASLAEPFGAYAATLTVLDWSPFERNTQLIGLQDLIGWNRLLWTAAAGALTAFAYARFRMQALSPSGTGKARKRGGARMTRKRADCAASEIPEKAPGVLRTLAMLTAFETRRVVKSAPFLIITFMSCAGLWFWVTMYGRAFGTGFYPYTGDMADHLHTVFEVPLMAVLIFYSADLVWSARDRKIHEIMDATPPSDALFFLSKLAALWTAVLTVLAAGVLTAVAFQLSSGFTEIDFGAYAVRVLAISAPYFFVMATLALALQALIGGRFSGMLAMIALYVGTLVANQAGLFNNLLIPGARLEAHHTVMAGYGHYLAPAVWFRGYWFAAAGLLAVFAAGAWLRGSRAGLQPRLGQLKSRLCGGYGIAAAAMALIVVVSGGFIAWNTMVLNEVESPRRADQLAAEYERLYVGWRDRAQPELETVSGRLELFPQTRHFELTGVYGLVNQTEESIDEVLLAAPPGADMNDVSASAPATVEHDRKHASALIRLEAPLPPGGALDVEFTVASEPIRGFTNRPQRTPVAHDGSLVFYNEFLPTVGYSRARELGDEHAREDFGLPERRSGVRAEGDPRGLSEQEGQTFADWVDIDLTVGTVQDQVPIAQGELMSTWQENGRTYARFVSGPPVKLHMGVVSGSYQTVERLHQGVDGPIRITVSHFPTHGRNAELLLDGLQQTLETLEANFGPYPYTDLRLVEASMGGPNCRIRSDTLICDSSLGFINDPRLDDPQTPPSLLVRVPAGMLSNLYIQSMIMPANQPGATSIADGLGFYLSGLVWRDMVTERAVAESVRDAAWHYFTHRAVEDDGEGTIVDHVNQTYVGAHKNSVVMYGLDYYLGRDRMNEAIRGFLEARRFEQPPYAKESDLVGAFRTIAPDAVQPIITDLFERRTLFDIAALAAYRRPLSGGGYELEIDVRAAKMYAQPNGELREAEFDYPVELVVFGERDRTSGEREILHRQQVAPDQLSNGRVRLVVDRRPEEVGLDPFFRLLDRNYLDNRTSVEDR